MRARHPLVLFLSRSVALLAAFDEGGWLPGGEWISASSDES